MPAFPTVNGAHAAPQRWRPFGRCAAAMSMKRRVEALASVQTLSVPRAALSRRDLAVVGRRPRSRRRTPCGLGVRAGRIERDDEIRGDRAVEGVAIYDLDRREARRMHELPSEHTFHQ